MSDGWLCSLSRPLQPVVGAPTIRTYVLTITRTLPELDAYLKDDGWKKVALATWTKTTSRGTVRITDVKPDNFAVIDGLVVPLDVITTLENAKGKSYSRGAPPLKPSGAVPQGAPGSATLSQESVAPPRSDLPSAEFALRYGDVESRLKQRLTQAGLDGQGTISLVRRESERGEAYASAGRSIPPYTEQANIGDIFAEEARLIDRAKAEGFFWDQAQVDKVLSAAVRKTGGTEHDVFFIKGNPNDFVIKSTIRDSYGYAFRSPAQYLKRLEDYNSVFPEAQMRLIGVAQNIEQALRVRVRLNNTKRSAPAEKIGDGGAEPCAEGSKKVVFKEYAPHQHAEPMQMPSNP